MSTQSGTIKDLHCFKCGCGVIAGVAYIEHGGRIEHAFGCPIESEVTPDIPRLCDPLRDPKLSWMRRNDNEKTL